MIEVGHTHPQSELMQRWEERFPGATPLGRQLLRQYDEAGRRYHDVQHLAEVLAHCDALIDEAANPRIVELAAWFHDAVYDVHRGDSEERSARLATAALPAYSFDADEAAETARLVRLTATHEVADHDHDAAVLCDADLAILGSDRERYDEYTRQVRAEYHHVLEPDFLRGRREVLQRLLDHESLFHTALGREWWEQRARENIGRELSG